MGFGLVQLNQGNILASLLRECIQKCLKLLTIETLILSARMPTTQWFNDTVDPVVIALPLHPCHRVKLSRDNKDTTKGVWCSNPIHSINRS